MGIIVIMKRIGLLLLLPFVLVLSCETTPAPQVPEEPAESIETIEPIETVTPVVPQEPPEEPPQVVVEPPVEEFFDPGSISEEKLAATKADIQSLIEELNRIIRARNYNAWLGYLDDSYLSEISSPAFLEEKTEELYRRDQIVASNMGRDPRNVEKKILRTPRDYFDNVVVPSRANDRVDDIAYISETRVRAYTVDSRGNRLILYDLAIIGEKWKIVG